MAAYIRANISPDLRERFEKFGEDLLKAKIESRDATLEQIAFGSTALFVAALDSPSSDGRGDAVNDSVYKVDSTELQSALGQSEHEQIVLWLRERRDIAERRDRTLRWIALTAALFAAILSFAAAVYFGFYPRPPIEASLDPDTVYRDGVAIGHVSAFNVEPVLAGQYVFQVEASKPINKGDMLRFRRAVCFVVDLGHPAAIA